MALNPDKKKCAHPGCRAWAKRGQDLCASHSRSIKVGAPEGNQNAIKHGFYSVAPSVPARGTTQAGNVEIRTVPTLDDEIALLASRRDAVDQWMMARLEAGEPVEVLKYLALIGQIGSRIARMLKTRDTLGGSGDIIEGLFSEALDLLSERIEVEV